MSAWPSEMRLSSLLLSSSWLMRPPCCRAWTVRGAILPLELMNEVGGLWYTEASVVRLSMSSSRSEPARPVSDSAEIGGFSARTTALAAAGSLESRRQ